MDSKQGPHISSQEEIIANYIQLLNQNPDLISFLQNTPDLRIVSIGCGKDPIELFALSRVINHPYSFTGIDIDADAIANHQVNFSHHVNCNFIALDAADHQKVKETLNNQKVHLVIFRHPPLYVKENISVFSSLQWAFLKTTPEILINDGYIVVSNYFDEEFSRTDNLISAITTNNLVRNTGANLVALIEQSWTKVGYGELAKQSVPLTAEHSFVVAKFCPPLFLEFEEKLSGFYQESDQVAEALINTLLIKEKKEGNYDVFSHPQMIVDCFFQKFVDKLAQKPEEVLKNLHAELKEISTELENTPLESIKQLSGSNQHLAYECLGEAYNPWSNGLPDMQEFYDYSKPKPKVAEGMTEIEIKAIPDKIKKWWDYQYEYAKSKVAAAYTRGPEQRKLFGKIAKSLLQIASLDQFKTADLETRKTHLLKTMLLISQRPDPEDVPAQQQKQIRGYRFD